MNAEDGAQRHDQTDTAVGAVMPAALFVRLVWRVRGKGRGGMGAREGMETMAAVIDGI